MLFILILIYPFYLKAENSEILGLNQLFNDKKEYQVIFVIISDNKSI